MAGEMTLGTLVGFYILAEMFLAPVGRFLEFADKRHALETDLQRLDDISKTPEDPVFSRRSPETASIPTFNGRLQLAGQLELRNVTFGFNRGRPPLLKDFNLTIKPGQRVAVVGPSGSGKSTLARLVSGIYRPWSGEILFDGHVRGTRFRRKCCGSPFPWSIRRSCFFPHRSATTSHCGIRRFRTRRSSPRRGMPGFMTKSWSGRGDTRPSSRKAGRISAAASASGWRSPVRWWATRRY